MADIAIIGCGFSGAMVLAGIVRKTTRPLSIAVCDPNPEPAMGIAYATRKPFHLLNVRSHKMGAFPEDERGFLTWLETNEAKTFSANHGIKTEWREGEFAPRMLYGAYLQSIWEHTLITAKEKNIAVSLHPVEVNEIIPQHDHFRLLSKNNAVEANIIVLATGNRFTKDEGQGRYVHDVWNFDFKAFAEAESKNSNPALILGSGLTAIDTVFSLWDGGWKKPIYMVSRRALLPAIHETYMAYNGDPIQENSLLVLMRDLREKSSKADSWQAVIDSLRPHTLRLWSALSVKEKRYFFRKLFTYWNIHRHRMAPEIGKPLTQAIEKQEVVLKQGRLIGTKEEADSIEANTSTGALKLAAIFHCVGPDYRGITEAPLLATLFKQNMLEKSLVGFGLITDDAGVAYRDAKKAIYAMGNYCLGERLETTAVPELREQAQNIADSIA